jgi:glycerophosphoryl diester phosphodiesterase
MFDLRQRKNGRQLLVGHRGAMDAAPENTFPAFEAGLAGGADILELDVQRTADNQIIIFHDILLKNKTGERGMIKDYPAKFLQSLDVGSHFGEAFAGTRMPLLDEVLSWAKNRTTLMIELKHGPFFDPPLDEAVVRLIEDHDMVDNVVIISFDQFALQRVKQYNANITTSLIYIGRFLNPLALVEGMDVDALSPATDLLTQDDVKRIQNAGYACTPGGFLSDYPTLLEWGVDTISSNDPASINWEEISKR